MTPETMAQLRSKLEHDEDRRTKPYTDSVGKTTIGVGHNLTDKGLPETIVDELLTLDIDEAIADLNANLPWWSEMSERRQMVLANMCFNMGIKTLLGFHRTLAAMQNGEYEAAADGMVASAWAREVGPRATRLITIMREG